MFKNDSLPYVGASVSFGSGILGHFNNITLYDVGVIVGILMTISTFLMSWYYKAKENKRAEALFKAQLEKKAKEKKHNETS
ncbi:HP1 family phage holin [Ursidibacter sp. B-7004-1]